MNRIGVSRMITRAIASKQPRSTNRPSPKGTGYGGSTSEQKLAAIHFRSEEVRRGKEKSEEELYRAKFQAEKEMEWELSIKKAEEERIRVLAAFEKMRADHANHKAVLQAQKEREAAATKMEKSTPFTLSEIEEAQKMIEEIKGS